MIRNISIASFLLLGCAKDSSSTLVATSQLMKTATVSQVSGTTASCIVTFYQINKPGVAYLLESSSVVVCNGHVAKLVGSSYATTFQNYLPNPVLLTIVRPDVGSTSSEYISF